MDEDQNEIILIKKYKLLEKVGSGSFGSIFKCTIYFYFRSKPRR
jgi:hypothetical protein